MVAVVFRDLSCFGGIATFIHSRDCPQASRSTSLCSEVSIPEADLLRVCYGPATHFFAILGGVLCSAFSDACVYVESMHPSPPNTVWELQTILVSQMRPTGMYKSWSRSALSIQLTVRLSRLLVRKCLHLHVLPLRGEDTLV